MVANSAAVKESACGAEVDFFAAQSVTVLPAAAALVIVVAPVAAADGVAAVGLPQGRSNYFVLRPVTFIQRGGDSDMHCLTRERERRRQVSTFVQCAKD